MGRILIALAGSATKPCRPKANTRTAPWKPAGIERWIQRDFRSISPRPGYHWRFLRATPPKHPGADLAREEGPPQHLNTGIGKVTDTACVGPNALQQPEVRMTSRDGGARKKEDQAQLHCPRPPDLATAIATPPAAAASGSRRSGAGKPSPSARRHGSQVAARGIGREMP